VIGNLHRIALKLKSMKRKKQFSKVYFNKAWSSGDSTSGVGSTLENTVGVRKIIGEILVEYNISSILDAPCGDFNWFQNFFTTNEHNEVTYLGLDIVESVIESNIVKNTLDFCKFASLDLARENWSLPSFDLIICRDLLVHLSIAEGSTVIRNFRQSGSRYLLITHFQSHSPEVFLNSEIRKNFGLFGWRPLSMTDSIYGLGTPVKIWEENSTEIVPSYLVKTLALFEINPPKY
jgi:hypothetical protein